MKTVVGAEVGAVQLFTLSLLLLTLFLFACLGCPAMHTRPAPILQTDGTINGWITACRCGRRAIFHRLKLKPLVIFNPEP